MTTRLKHGEKSAVSLNTFPLLPGSSSQPTKASGILIAPRLLPSWANLISSMHVVEVEAEMADVVQAKPPGTRERMSSGEIGGVAVLTVRPLTESPAELSLRKDQLLPCGISSTAQREA